MLNISKLVDQAPLEASSTVFRSGTRLSYQDLEFKNFAWIRTSRSLVGDMVKSYL